MKICVFARYPRFGKVKSRLAAKCGQQKALFLYQKMLHRMMTLLVPIKEKVCFYTTGCSESEGRHYFGQFDFKLQIEGSLGEKLGHALINEWQESSGKIVFLGVDCLELSLEHIEQTFELLESKGVVIGPAKDGGYYLIGMSQESGFLFEDVDWGTSRVLDQTIKKINAAGLNCTLLEELNDVDYWHDLPDAWQQEVQECL